MDDQRVARIVERVVARLRAQGIKERSSFQRAPSASAGSGRYAGKHRPDTAPTGGTLLRARSQEPKVESREPRVKSPYADVDRACEAAGRAFLEFRALGFSARAPIVEAMRAAALEHAERWAHEAVAETGLGRVEDKIKKNRLVARKTPGPEILGRPETCTGSDGLTATERAPFGLIASIIPCTNPTETVINNGISMVAAGNSVVFGPHPIAKKVSLDAVQTLNRAIRSAGGPEELLGGLAEPGIEAAGALMRHELVRLLMVTGGGGVVEAAMKSGKRAICAGPGNPPALVDETADIGKAGRDITAGASLDNNIICTDEKLVVAVESIAGALKEAMRKAGCVELKGGEIERLTDLVLAERGGPYPSAFPTSPAALLERSASPPARGNGRRSARRGGAPNRKFVGQNASVILRELGLAGGDEVRLILVDVPPEHPLAWTEQLMPVLPLVRARGFEEALAYAVAVEAKRRHTASIHSRRMDRITAYARAMNCSICVANGPNFAGLGLGGEGYTSFSIATPTGEGLTNARTFTRERRLALCAGALNFA